MKKLLGPLKVFWFGMWRVRTLNQVKYYNRVKWFISEGYKGDDIKKFLTLEKLEPLRDRMNKEGWTGSRRNRRLSKTSRQIVRALKAHNL